MKDFTKVCKWMSAFLNFAMLALILGLMLSWAGA